MKNIENEKFVKRMSNVFYQLSSFYKFYFDETTKSIMILDNRRCMIEKDDLETLICGLENYKKNVSDQYIKDWNQKIDDEMNGKLDSYEVYEASNNISKNSKKQGHVYFVQDATGLVKIGLSKDAHRRVLDFSTSNPSIQLLFLIKTNNMDVTEKLFHEHFKNKRVKGEWFNLSKNDIKYILSGKYTKEIMDSIGGTNG